MQGLAPPDYVDNKLQTDLRNAMYHSFMSIAPSSGSKLRYEEGQFNMSELAIRVHCARLDLNNVSSSCFDNADSAEKRQRPFNCTVVFVFCEPTVACCHRRVVVPERPFSDVQRFGQQNSRFLKLGLVSVDERQNVEHGGNVWVFAARLLLQILQRLLAERDRHLVPSLRRVLNY